MSFMGLGFQNMQWIRHAMLYVLVVQRNKRFIAFVNEGIHETQLEINMCIIHINDKSTH